MSTVKLTCPACNAGLTLNLQPPQVLDLICEWSDRIMSDERPAVACVRDGEVLLSLLFNTQRVRLTVRLGVEVPRNNGSSCKFSLCKLAPSVLKLSPSVVSDPYGLHAFVTIVGAPTDLDISKEQP